MNNNFDKGLYTKNIRFLANQQGKKIGDLEKAAGVSVGYISRIDKDSSSAALSVEALYILARELGVNLDLLVGTDMEDLSSTERYLFNFFQKLGKDTNEDEAIWVKLDRKNLLNENKDAVQQGYYPLLCVDNELLDIADDGQPICAEEIVCAEPFSKDIFQSCIAGDWFYFELDYGKRLYLTEVDCTTEKKLLKKILETYIVSFDPEEVRKDMVRSWTSEPLCQIGRASCRERV